MYRNIKCILMSTAYIIRKFGCSHTVYYLFIKIEDGRVMSNCMIKFGTYMKLFYAVTNNLQSSMY